jgi:hypothetical protein
MTTVPGRAQHTMPLRAVQQASIPVPNLSWLTCRPAGASSPGVVGGPVAGRGPTA